MKADRGLDGAWRLSAGGSLAALVLGACLAVSGLRAGAWLMVAALVAGLGANVWLSVVKYRRTMRRAWPVVQPVADEDDW